MSVHILHDHIYLYSLKVEIEFEKSSDPEILTHAVVYSYLKRSFGHILFRLLLLKDCVRALRAQTMHVSSDYIIVFGFRHDSTDSILTGSVNDCKLKVTMWKFRKILKNWVISGGWRASFGAIQLETAVKWYAVHYDNACYIRSWGWQGVMGVFQIFFWFFWNFHSTEFFQKFFVESLSRQSTFSKIHLVLLICT